jgi:hypothetical protein
VALKCAILITTTRNENHQLSGRRTVPTPEEIGNYCNISSFLDNQFSIYKFQNRLAVEQLLLLCSDFSYNFNNYGFSVDSN